jgi:hypothetical protein
MLLPFLLIHLKSTEATEHMIVLAGPGPHVPLAEREPVGGNTGVQRDHVN